MTRYTEPEYNQRGRGSRPQNVRDMNALGRGQVFGQFEDENFPGGYFGENVQVYPDDHNFQISIGNESSPSDSKLTLGWSRGAGFPDYTNRDFIILFKDGASKVLEKTAEEVIDWTSIGANGILYYQIDISDYDTITAAKAVLKGAATLPASTTDQINYPLAAVKWDTGPPAIIGAVEPMQYENIVISFGYCANADEVWISVVKDPDDLNCKKFNHIGPDVIEDLKYTVLSNFSDPGGTTLVAAHARIQAIIDAMIQAINDRTGHLIKLGATGTDSSSGDESSGNPDEESGSNQQWRKCSDNTDLTIFTPANAPPHNYAWVLDGGIFIKAHKFTTTASAASDPCFVVHQTIERMSCVALTLADFSDNFNDNSLDLCRWNNNTGVPTESGGKINWSTTGGDVGIQNGDFPEESGDFSMLIDFSLIFNVVGGRTGDNGSQFIARGGSNPIDIIISIQPAGQVRVKARCGGGESITNLSSGNKSGQYLLERVSGTVNVKYDIGAGFITARSAVAADVTNRIDMRGVNDGSNGGTASGTFDNLVVT